MKTIKGIPKKEYQKAYYEKNKEKNKTQVAKYQKAYYEKNKEKINQRRKSTHVNIPTFGRTGKQHIFTNGVTEQMKPLVLKIKDKVLSDCIKNPRKYLEGGIL